MKQTRLWSGDEGRVQAPTWSRLPEQVRAEVIAQFVRLVVASLIDDGKKLVNNNKEKQ